MSRLTIYKDNATGEPEVISDPDAIVSRLAALGVEFERWKAAKVFPADAGQEEVLAAYEDAIARLNKRYGFQSVDVVALRPDHPDRVAMRQKFLAEHTHADFEVRFFVEGKGLFYLHCDDLVYLVLCEHGDLISVPAQTRHWFDMGERPDFKCIRFFTRPDGWVATFTGSDIAKRFPTFDEHLAARS
jgi:1,2-dihydroxy-3-keto-5-methylthiopentene dioxygenase